MELAPAGRSTTAAGGWSNVNTDDAKSMDSEQHAREQGEQCSSASSFGGGDHSFGRGFRGSGAERGGGASEAAAVVAVDERLLRGDGAKRATAPRFIRRIRLPTIR
jgi:hypothetical protein